MTELELYHHGVLGQKWGVRREQKKRAKIERKISKYGSAAKAAAVEQSTGRLKSKVAKNAIQTASAVAGAGVAFTNPLLGVSIGAIGLGSSYAAKAYVRYKSDKKANEILTYNK